MAKAMYAKGEDNRSELIGTATRLFLTQGFESTTFQDLAQSSGVPKGNIYYYFKSKDELLDAVLARRLDVLDEQISLLNESSDDPLRRMNNFLDALFSPEGELVLYGCPHGSLCLELAKGKPELMEKASIVLRRLADWFTEQFRQAGVASPPAFLAFHMLMRMEGISLVGAALRDQAFMDREVQQLQRWIERQRHAPAPAALADS